VRHGERVTDPRPPECGIAKAPAGLNRRGSRG
jgi:hypothetical protein